MRLVVGVVDGDQETVAVDAEFLGDQVPGELDRPFLEVIAEGEIAEHLEEGVVAGGITDIVEVVVLSAGAHAFLRGCSRRVGALFETGKDVLELHHAGIGEHQCRIVARHQRAGGNDLVTVRLEVIEKSRPDVVYTAHVTPFIQAGKPANLQNQWLLSSGSLAVQQPQRKPAASRKKRGRHKKIRQGRKPYMSSAPSPSLASGPPFCRKRSAISPAFCLSAISISCATGGLSRRKSLAFSRPWPRRWLL